MMTVSSLTMPMEKRRSPYRDSANGNRITAIYAPSSLNEDGTKPEGAIPQFKYEYDAQGNLSKVYKLIDRTKPVDQQYAVTEYLYENADRPHYVTAIKDPMGNIPMKCIYDEDGRLIATEDANGNRIAMNHDLSGRTETITDRMGNPTIHTYDEMGNVTATIDAQGNATRYTYDNLGNKLSETNALGYTTSYTYDSNGNRTSKTDALNNITKYEYDSYGKILKITDPLGNTTSNEYDAKGNQTAVVNAVGARTYSVYDSSGNATATYDTNGNIIASFKMSSTGQVSSFTDSSGVLKSITYNANGQQTSMNYSWTDPSGEQSSINISSQMVYDDAGNHIAEINQNGDKKTFVYNLAGQMIRSISFTGQITEYKYNTAGKLIETQYGDGTFERNVYDENDRVIYTQERHTENIAAMGTRTIYDSTGRVIRQERLSNLKIGIMDGKSYYISSDDAAIMQTNEYDAAGRVIRTIDAKGNVKQYFYDVLNRKIAEVDPLGNRTEYGYNANGAIVSVKDAKNNISRMEYDAIGMPIKTINPDGTYKIKVYDNLSRIVQEIDEAGYGKKMEYNEKGNIISISQGNLLSGDTLTWTYTYDMFNNRTSIKDPKGNITKFTYNYRNQLTSRTLPLGQKETYQYDSFGRIIARLDFKGNKIEQSYDNFGRVIELNYFSALSQSIPEETVQITYDGLGRQQIISVQRDDMSEFANEFRTEFTYDNFNRIKQKTTPQGSINYEYDDVTNQITQISTANNSQSYSYDALKRLKTVSITKLNGVIQETPAVTTYEYTPTGSRAAVTLPNGIRTTYQYDAMNRLLQMDHRKSDNTLHIQYKYDLDVTGRRKQVSEIREIDGVTISSVIRYKYDSFYRLVEESRTGNNAFQTVYDYDQNNNRTHKVHITNGTTERIEYSYNANDLLLEENSNTKGKTQYTYDANGSVLSKINIGKFNYQYAYNSRNRLSSVAIYRTHGSNDINLRNSYAYDYNGNRVLALENINNEITRKRIFLLDAGLTGYEQVLEETSSLGTTPVRSYILADDVIGQANTNTPSYFLYDGHGSTRNLVDSEAKIAANYEYDAFGRMLENVPEVTAPSQTDILYAGEQFDTGLQMQYLRTRYYDPENGRFNRLDPASGNIQEPMSLHKYSYAGCDPVNNIDPSGESFIGVMAITMILMSMVTLFLPAFVPNVSKTEAPGWAFGLYTSGSASLFNISINMGAKTLFSPAAKSFICLWDVWVAVPLKTLFWEFSAIANFFGTLIAMPIESLVSSSSEAVSNFFAGIMEHSADKILDLQAGLGYSAGVIIAYTKKALGDLCGLSFGAELDFGDGIFGLPSCVGFGFGVSFGYSWDRTGKERGPNGSLVFSAGGSLSIAADGSVGNKFLLPLSVGISLPRNVPDWDIATDI